MKKRICGLLALALVVSLAGLCYAAEEKDITETEVATAYSVGKSVELSEHELESISDALYGVEMQKERLGLSDVDFTDLQVGAPIQAYVYIEDSFEPKEVMYPITYDGELILWVINNEGQFQLTTALVNEVSSSINASTPFAIVYDRYRSYLYANESFTQLKPYAIEIPSRSVLDTTNSVGIELSVNNLTPQTILDYSTFSTRAQRYFECDVDYVTQNPYDHLCWAASCACIVNYCNGTNLTTYNVATNYYGFTDYNRGLLPIYGPDVLANYGLSYTFKSQSPSGNTVLENIQAGYPLLTSWQSYGGVHHATCVYATDIMNGNIYVMDPEAGFTTATHFNDEYDGYIYRYYSAAVGDWLYSTEASCHSW